jgi:hypothetical protein
MVGVALAEMPWVAVGVGLGEAEGVPVLVMDGVGMGVPLVLLDALGLSEGDGVRLEDGLRLRVGLPDGEVASSRLLWFCMDPHSNAFIRETAQSWHLFCLLKEGEKRNTSCCVDRRTRAALGLEYFVRLRFPCVAFYDGTEAGTRAHAWVTIERHILSRNGTKCTERLYAIWEVQMREKCPAPAVGVPNHACLWLRRHVERSSL